MLPFGHVLLPIALFGVTPDQNSGMLTYEGRVEVVDDESGQSDWDGWIEFHLGNMSPKKRIPITNGRWRAEIPEVFDVMSVGRLHLDGRSAHPVDRAFIPPPGQEHVLQVRWTPVTTLHAYAAETAEELERVVAVLADRKPYWLPGSKAGLAPSPLSLDGWNEEDLFGTWWKDERTWWIGAPGYAWTGTTIHHDRGDTLFLVLEPDTTPRGDLHVSVSGPGAEHVARLILTGRDFRAPVNFDDCQGWGTLEHVPARFYVLEAWSYRNGRIAHSSVKVCANVTVDVVLEVPAVRARAEDGIR